MNHKTLEQHFFEAKATILVIIDKDKDVPDFVNKLKENHFVFCFWFDDVETDEQDAAGRITFQQGQKILNVIKECSTSEIIVSCVGGVSRSPAVAAAVLLALGLDDMVIWRNGSFCPNETVFQTIAEVGNFDLSNLSQKSACNLAAWKEKNNM